MYNGMPLYPCMGRDNSNSCVKLPLFPLEPRCDWKRDCCEHRCCEEKRLGIPAAPPITIVNPRDCRECAVVYLSIDECGNLIVCVRREERYGKRCR